ncbi:MAG: aminotransferase class I/II-fold pyridoxal phosphate-dependent enzyme, partial [Polyangiaceae bacterium]|nr:aminotransferase class I/II-fold pyridoxal phosphate-dependent enzyme [Polyangiaceae bacterium]
DRDGQVIYVGSLSKVLAPGLRIGYVAAPRALLDRLARIRTHVDRQGDSIAEAAVAELLEEGEIARHVRATRRIYASRQTALVEALRSRLGSRLRFSVPLGGMALWVRADSSVDVARWAERALARGVLFRPGRELHLEARARSYARVGFSRVDEAEIERAVEALAVALEESTRPARQRRSLPAAAGDARTRRR